MIRSIAASAKDMAWYTVQIARVVEQLNVRQVIVMMVLYNADSVTLPVFISGAVPSAMVQEGAEGNCL